MAEVTITDDNNVERLGGTARFPAGLAHTSTGAPSGAPADGVQFHIDTDSDGLYFWTGAAWVLVAND